LLGSIFSLCPLFRQELCDLPIEEGDARGSLICRFGLAGRFHQRG
jgi:hypothetical protein